MDWATSTNKGSALLKFIHQQEQHRLFEDEWVALFLDDHERAVAHQLRDLIHSDSTTDEAAFLRYVYAFVNLREAYGDRAIAQAIQSGCQQLLLLGSGYDTRFFRLPILQNSAVETFEVDLPATITTKRHYLEQALPKLPHHLIFVDIDFNHQPLSRLFNAGFRADRPTVVVWQGVSYYLPQENVSQVLDFVLPLLTGASQLIFDCCTPLMLTPNDIIPGVRYNIANLDRIGEPYRFGLEPNEMKTWLQEKGFQAVNIHLLDNVEQEFLNQKTLPTNGWYFVTTSAQDI